MNPEVDAFLKSECFTPCFLLFHEADTMVHSQKPHPNSTRALVSVRKVDPQNSTHTRTDTHIALLVLRLAIAL
jgi:hypothetical protein